MKNRKNKGQLALIISIITLITCSSIIQVKGQQDEDTLGSSEASNGRINRTFTFAPSEQVKYTVSQMQYTPSKEELPYNILEMDMRFIQPWFMTPNDAKEDVERLFYLLENGYAGYGFFKTKGDFQEAKNNILAEIDTKLFLRSNELSQIIHNHLNFIHDCHLSIGDQEYENHYDFWYNTEFELRKENQNYIIEINETEYTVLNINNENPDQYIFPSLNSEGKRIYRIGVMSTQTPHTLKLDAIKHQQSKQLEIVLTKSEPEYEELFSDKKIGGVPVVRIGSFSDQHVQYVNQFLECAEKYRDEPCLIVDVRGNGGGNTAYARQWVTRYTGKEPGMIQIYSELFSETSMMGRSNYFSYLLHNYPKLETQGYSTKAEQFMKHAQQVEVGESNRHWSSYSVPSPKKIPSNKTLIVLIDSNVGSAAEGFLCYLQQVENVVFVGENSGGALTYGQMSMHILPNSRLPVRLPISLNVFTDLVYREERGFYPDLWVPAGNALNYAVAGVREGSIITTDSFVKQVESIDFVPHTPSKKIDLLSLIPVVLVLFYGGVLVYFNRQRNWVIFGIGSFVGVVLGLYYLDRRPSFGYAFLIVGIEYLAIAVIKRKRDMTVNSNDSL